MNWQGKRALVTGAGGFIGSHLAEKLVSLGAKTGVLVHYRADGSWGWLDSSPYVDQMEVFAGDVCDRDTVYNAMRGNEIVFHLASLIGIPYSYHAPLSYVRTNVEGTMNVLQAARENQVERLVHTSTSEVYGTAQYVPIDEAHPLQAQSPYAASKIGADKLAEAFHLSFGVPVATVRPFNTFGPRQSARAIIPTIIVQALSCPTVHLGNLEPTRDFNYVMDTVEAFIRVAESPDAAGQVFNIGTGREISIGNLASLILDLVGVRNGAITSEEERIRPANSEVDRLCADTRKAAEITGWSSEYALEDGLVQTIKWIRGNLDRYKPASYAI